MSMSMSSQNTSKNSLIKNSDLGPTAQAVADAIRRQLARDKALEQAKSNILSVAGLGLGAGSMLAGAKMLARLNREQLASKEIPIGGSVQVDLFAPKKRRNLRKQVDEGHGSYAPPPMILPMQVPPTSKVAEDGLYSEVGRMAQAPGQWFKDIGKAIVNSPNAQKPMDFSWYAPAFVGAGLGAAGLSHMVVDSALKRARKQLMKRQLATAEQEYEAALQADFDKTSTDRPELAKQFDRIVAAVERSGFDKSSQDAASIGAQNMASRTAGIYLTLMALAAAAGARSGYGAGKKEWKSNALRRAQLQRLQLNNAGQPVEIYADPVDPEKDAQIPQAPVM